MLSKSLIEQVVRSQKERFDNRDLGLLRYSGEYDSIGSHALIITGIRRCGKSTLLQQIKKHSEGSSVFLNFEDPRLTGFDAGDLNKLHDLSLLNKVQTYYFDELQNVKTWENFVRFRLDEGYRIFITGSNASMLSRELGTKLTGRHLNKELFPFSYREYLDFNKEIRNTDSLQDYLVNGGFPEYLKVGLTEVLMQVFNDIIIRDIAVRYGLKNTKSLRQLALWLVSNTGKRFTGNSLRKTMNIGSSSSIMDYLSYFEDAYLFFYLPRFSYSYKVQLVNPKKVYCIDNGLVVTNSTSFTDDTGRLLENMVFLHLRRKTRELYYFAENGDCDFVMYTNGKLTGIFQVCAQLNQDNTDREIKGLLECMDFFNQKEAEIITLNQEDEFKIDGKVIKVLPFHLWKNSQ